MNSLLEHEFPLGEAQAMRYDVLNMLTDGELAYRLPGDNVTLGELCREMGEVERAYIQSFRTLRYTPSQQSGEPGRTDSVEGLAAWYRDLDEEFEAVVKGLSDDDLHLRRVDRGDGFSPSLHVQFQCFHEAVLMFYAKASIYLKALQKPLSEKWRTGVG